jgi:hypothetical protein
MAEKYIPLTEAELVRFRKLSNSPLSQFEEAVAIQKLLDEVKFLRGRLINEQTKQKEES